MLSIVRIHSSKIIIALIGLSVFIYVFTKAGNSSFTHDESFTYLHYCHTRFLDIISYSDWYSNNHLLNSLFIKYSELLFGNSELALRLPNLLLLVVYLFYSYFLFKRKNPLLAILIFTFLSMNIPLTDIFGLARGYGISIGFMLMSFYHFVAWLKNNSKKNLYLFHFGALLASLSNFTLLVFYLAMLLASAIFFLIKQRISQQQKLYFIKENLIHLPPLLISGIVLYEPVRRVISYNHLDFGGNPVFLTIQ